MTLAAPVYDLSAGTPLDQVQFCPTEGVLYYYTKNSVLVAKEAVRAG